MVDAGVDDKRLMVLKREGNTVSRIVRDAWDCREMIGSLIKHSPTRATDPYISIIGHITIDELQQTLDHTSMANGYANRFLFACVRRSKKLPHGGTQDEEITRQLAARALEALIFAWHRTPGP